MVISDFPSSFSTCLQFNNPFEKVLFVELLYISWLENVNKLFGLCGIVFIINSQIK